MAKTARTCEISIHSSYFLFVIVPNLGVQRTQLSAGKRIFSRGFLRTATGVPLKNGHFLIVRAHDIKRISKISRTNELRKRHSTNYAMLAFLRDNGSEKSRLPGREIRQVGKRVPYNEKARLWSTRLI